MRPYFPTVALAVFSLSVLFPLQPAARAASQPVSISELDLWLRAGRSSADILSEVTTRGLLEPVNADAQRRLRADGADAALLARLNDGNFLVSPDAAEQARAQIAAQTEKERTARAQALLQLRAAQQQQLAPTPPAPTQVSSGADVPPPGQTPPGKGIQLAVIPEPPGSGADGWKTGFINARKQAAEEHKMVLVDFTGSDWCSWCKKLEQEIFLTPEFKSYAAQKLVLMRADYPQRHPQPAEVKEQNAKLAEAFKVTGYPTVYVLNEAGKPIGKFGYEAGGAGPFLAKLRALEGK